MSEAIIRPAGASIAGASVREAADIREAGGRNGPARTAAPAPSLTVEAIVQQVRHDLFGTKDVQDSPTMTYTWVADQFGHFNIGLVGSLVLTLIAVMASDALIGPGIGRTWAQWIGTGAGALVAALFTFKEVRDYVIAKRNARGVFVFNAKDVQNNCLVACFYTFAGIAVLIASVWNLRLGAWVAVAAIVVQIPVAIWWLKRKVAFQQADLPYLYRLANFPDNFVDRGDMEVIREFADPNSNAGIRHVIVDGQLASGKTSLAIGIATEFAFRLGIGRFISAVKLNQTGRRDEAVMPGRKRVTPGTVVPDGRVLWPLNDVRLLVVDDLDLGLVHPAPIDPTAVENALRTSPGAEFFEAFRDRKTLWIAGTRNQAPEWKDVVTNLVAKDFPKTVHVVKLKGTLAAALKEARPATAK